MSTNPELNRTQIAALRALSHDAGARVEPATLSKLRKLGLVGRRIKKDSAGRQKTTSPVTSEGHAKLRELVVSAVTP